MGLLIIVITFPFRRTLALLNLQRKGTGMVFDLQCTTFAVGTRRVMMVTRERGVV